MVFLKLFLALNLTVVLGLLLWRLTDTVRANAAWSRLASVGADGVAVFDPAMVAGLPEPARRYFNFTIAPGTRLSTVAVIEMDGQLGLGTKDNPKYQPMRARQILAPPHGLLWRLNTGMITGSDAALPETSWTRFWLFHLAPLVRISGDPDHHRSAFGRVVSEAAFWAPAALLPSSTVTWEARGDGVARATVTFGAFTQWVDITVGEDGAPLKVVIERWSNANSDGEYRLQPFGGLLSEYRTFDGFRVPTRVDGGNLIDTPDYFPFFRAKVTALEFL
jgi:hypothetical protein